MKQKTNLIVTKAQTMERFCKDLSGHAMKMLNFEEKEMIPLTDKENKSYEKQKVSYICRKEFSTDENDKDKFKLYRKVSRKFRGAAHSICNLRCKTLKEILVVFHNGATYDYPFKLISLQKKFMVSLNA